MQCVAGNIIHGIIVINADNSFLVDEIVKNLKVDTSKCSEKFKVSMAEVEQSLRISPRMRMSFINLRCIAVMRNVIFTGSLFVPICGYGRGSQSSR